VIKVDFETSIPQNRLYPMIHGFRPDGRNTF
jgi:hypothetical protein